MSDPLDHQLLQELEMLMEGDFCSLLEAYLKDSEQRLFEVAEAWESGDLERLRHNAHSLKGASSNIGAAELAALCDGLEHLARDGDTARLPCMLDQVKRELQEVREAVEALRSSR